MKQIFAVLLLLCSPAVAGQKPPKPIQVGPSALIPIEEYKATVYLVIDLGTYDSVFNTLRMSQPSRLARVINEKVLSLVKDFYKLIAIDDRREVGGIKTKIKIPYKAFTDKNASPSYDDLLVYIPLAMIKKFIDDDITSQQLLDNSVVIVDNNRVQVSLAERN
jgi:hypothetical protein